VPGPRVPVVHWENFPMSRITLQFIADQLGISKFAVSRALTGKPGVSDETRRAVVSTAERLGYTGRPPKAAEVRSFEVLFHDRTVANRELWVDVQHGIEQEASRRGYPMAIRWSNDHTMIERLERSTIGFVLVGPHEKRMYEAARDSNVPAITVSHIVPALDSMDQITATDVEAGSYVADFLVGLGHRRLIYVHGRLGYPGRYARLRGFAEAIAGVDGAELREIAFEEDQAGAGFSAALMATVGEGFEPTCFFCGSDAVALTVVSELMRIGLEIPEDVSVVGHADYPIATQISPKLTTVHMPHRQMGIAAVRVLLSRAGLSTPVTDTVPMRISLVPNLVERQTTGSATTTSWRHKLRK
jgi:LacI family transcriptional regulator